MQFAISVVDRVCNLSANRQTAGLDIASKYGCEQLEKSDVLVGTVSDAIELGIGDVEVDAADEAADAEDEA